MKWNLVEKLLKVAVKHIIYTILNLYRDGCTYTSLLNSKRAVFFLPQTENIVLYTITLIASLLPSLKHILLSKGNNIYRTLCTLLRHIFSLCALLFFHSFFIPVTFFSFFPAIPFLPFQLLICDYTTLCAPSLKL